MKYKVNPLLLALALGIPSAQANETPKTAAATPAAGASIETAFVAPQSVFVIPASSREGRNPFFPKSKTDAPVSKTKPDVPAIAEIVLNGITGPPKRMAMINGRTFEPGETGDVKLQSGAKVSIQCLEIKDDSVIIVVGTQQRELRMRNGV